VRDLIIKEIVYRDISREAYDEYSSFVLNSHTAVTEVIRDTLASIPPTFGSCVMMSAGLVAALRAHHSIPAIAVLGDLLIKDIPIFKCGGNLPMPRYNGEVIEASWDGHCWVEIGGIICDLSIFRSAYAIQSPSLLKTFILEQFGPGKGAFLSYPEGLPSGMEFVPKHALSDFQISCVLEGLSKRRRESNQ
jgi:hypothetical protein